MIVTNYALNPSVEVNTSSITSWTDATLTRDASRAHSGNASLRTSVSASSGSGCLWHATPSQTGVWTFTMSAAIYNPNGIALRLIPFEYYSAGGPGSTTPTYLDPTFASDDWDRASVTGTTTSGMVSVRLLIASNGPHAAGTPFWTDAVQIQDGLVATDYFDGDSPNAEWTATPHASTSILTLPDRRIFPVLKVGSQHIGPLRAGKA